MSENLYQILSLGARYWFVFLGALIVLRSYRWLFRERSSLHRRLKRLPDAGMVGEFVVSAGSDQLPEGTVLPVPREGVLGFVRSCDIVLPVADVKKYHLDFRFENGKGLFIMPRSGCWALVNGHELNCRSRYSKYPMEHGSVLEIGEAVLKLRLFAGVDISRNAVFASDARQSEAGNENGENENGGIAAADTARTETGESRPDAAPAFPDRGPAGDAGWLPVSDPNEPAGSCPWTAYGMDDGSGRRAGLDPYGGSGPRDLYGPGNMTGWTAGTDPRGAFYPRTAYGTEDGSGRRTGTDPYGGSGPRDLYGPGNMTGWTEETGRAGGAYPQTVYGAVDRSGIPLGAGHDHGSDPGMAFGPEGMPDRRPVPLAAGVPSSRFSSASVNRQAGPDAYAMGPDRHGTERSERHQSEFSGDDYPEEWTTGSRTGTRKRRRTEGGNS